MPVWGKQATDCGVLGNPIGGWAGCVPDPFPFCGGAQGANQDQWDPPNCNIHDGGGTPPPNFTSAWPYLDGNTGCTVALLCGIFQENFNIFFDSPSRIDFPNDAIVYRAPAVWEGHALDDDYNFNLHSPGGELYDVEAGPPFDTRHDVDPRLHTEFRAGETINIFGDPSNPFGAANKFWIDLHNEVDNNSDDNVNAWLKSLVGGHTPMAVEVGVPSVDCCDHPHKNTTEIHPVLAMAIRIQENPQPVTNPQPEKWAFFYQVSGSNGGCGSKHYFPCKLTFQLPLGLPFVPAGQVLTSADVQVDAHPYANGFTPSDVTFASQFDLANGTILNVTLPGAISEGLVGLVTVTPVFDTTPPQITCPADINQPVDLGKCTAAPTFTPTISDDCSVSAVCSPPSGSAFPIGTATDTCTATDQAGLTASCSFNVTVTAGNKCPLAQGYWKNHTSLWPVSVNSLTLGSVTYSKTQLLSILNTSSTGDASVVLAKSEIAALLNLANGSNPVPICGTIADANGALDGSTVPAKVGPKTVLGQRMVSDANALDMYNNGKLTTGCTP
jgi:hypothetical protein